MEPIDATFAAMASGNNVMNGYFDKIIVRLIEPFIRRHELRQQAKTEQLLNELYPLEKIKAYKKIFDEDFLHMPECAQNEVLNLLKIGNFASQYMAADSHLQTDEQLALQADEWLNRFIDEAKYVTDEQLQQAFARLLKEKIYHPEVVNKRVLRILADLDAHELEEMNQFMSYFVDDTISNEVVYSEDDMYDKLLMAQHLRLVSNTVYFDFLHNYILNIHIDEKVRGIHGKGIHFLFDNVQTDFDIALKGCTLTKEGKVFRDIVTAKMPDEIIDIYKGIFEKACEGKATLRVERTE
jgi:hypothetical protein